MARGGRRWWMAAGVALGLLFGASRTEAAVFTVTLAGGSFGQSTPSVTNQFQYDPGDGSSVLALNQLLGGVSAKAVNNGGNVFFGGGGLPILFTLSDGHSYVASADAPADASLAVVGNNPLGNTGPIAGQPLPSSTALLTLAVTEPSEDGLRTISATVTDSLLNELGTTSITLPSDGWWVLGLGPATTGGENPGGEQPGGGDPGTGNPGGENPGGGDPGTGNPGGENPGGGDPTGPATTPEPSTFAMAALGAGALGWWRKRQHRVV